MVEPLVTALCITRNRREWLPQAISSFQRQTYPNKEMVILADSVADIAGLPFDADNLCVHVLGLSDPLPTGGKRNIGCHLSHGEIICHWDDDDYSAPGRIANQIAHLLKTNKMVTGYCAMKFTDGKQWWQYRGSGAGFVLGTSLCYRRSWWQTHPFPHLSVGEDSNFAAPAGVADQLAVQMDLDLMYATIHAGNTSQRVIIQGCWKELPDFVSPFDSVII